MQSVHVPQESGEIVITPGSTNEPVAYTVADGVVEVEDADVELFLLSVDGSHLDSSPAASPGDTGPTTEPGPQEA